MSNVLGLMTELVKLLSLKKRMNDQERSLRCPSDAPVDEDETILMFKMSQINQGLGKTLLSITTS